jgi:regulator of protease activity HflC (stomatin/prohibitin superfamily)
MTTGLIIGLIIVVFLILVLPSIRIIGPTEVGLVTKRFGKRLPENNPIAFNGEAGYQADLLMPGWRFKFWVYYSIEKFPWVQVPPGQIGVIIAQIGESPPIGAKSAKFIPEAKITDIKIFVDKGGEKGVQRPVLVPGTTLPLHPVAFLVLTPNKIYGKPLLPELTNKFNSRRGLTPEDFGLNSEDLLVKIIKPELKEGGKIIDIVGVVTTLEGDPLPPGDIAGRLGGFKDIADAIAEKRTDSELTEIIIGSKNTLHNNYQDFQAFIDKGGKIGLQHDPLLYGAYNLNPFLVKVEKVPMLVVEQGEVAVIKSYVGLAEESGRVDVEKNKFGTIVHPGHRGIWNESLRTGKYALNPHIYQVEIVPVSIITLNWATASTKAHEWDVQLQPIEAKSREGFVFKIDLQVQIHVAAVEAPTVISMVATMRNLTTDVLQPAVGNHFRDRLQGMQAISFIETRQKVQEDAYRYIEEKLQQYHVETRGVLIQDVVFPSQLVEVLTKREIANQEVLTYQRQRDAQVQRIEMEQQTGVANKQQELASARIGVEIKQKNAEARKAEADGEAVYLEKTNAAAGIGKAEGYKKQIEALGPEGTTLVNIISALADKNLKFVPEVVVGESSGASLSGLLGVLTGKYASELASKKTNEEKNKK